MKGGLSRLAAMVMALAASGGSGGPKEALKAGDPAPIFDLPGSDGGTHRLEDLRGRQEGPRGPAQVEARAGLAP